METYIAISWFIFWGKWVLVMSEDGGKWGYTFQYSDEKEWGKKRDWGLALKWFNQWQLNGFLALFHIDEKAHSFKRLEGAIKIDSTD